MSAYLDRRCTGARVVGDGRYAAVRLRHEIAEVAADLTGELAELVAEQAADDRRRRIGRGMVSLDGVDRFGRPLHEVVAA